MKERDGENDRGGTVKRQSERRERARQGVGNRERQKGRRKTDWERNKRDRE